SIDLHAAQGWCVYNDSLQQCTTYVNGRVEFTYVTISCHGGCDTIIVSALGKSASAFVYFDMDTMYTLDLHVSRDTLYVPVGSEDSTVISVWLKTGMGVGLADSTITLMASGGRFDYLPPTDSMGRASTWWHTNHEYGLFTLLASFSHATDTARIVVDSLLR
ncbi:hypothetical protein KJ815_02340, partial [bacterium]|nr:hypothetical protein [bacterium]